MDSQNTTTNSTNAENVIAELLSSPASSNNNNNNWHDITSDRDHGAAPVKHMDMITQLAEMLCRCELSIRQIKDRDDNRLDQIAQASEATKNQLIAIWKQFTLIGNERQLQQEQMFGHTKNLLDTFKLSMEEQIKQIIQQEIEQKIGAMEKKFVIELENQRDQIGKLHQFVLNVQENFDQKINAVKQKITAGHQILLQQSRNEKLFEENRELCQKIHVLEQKFEQFQAEMQRQKSRSVETKCGWICENDGATFCDEDHQTFIANKGSNVIKMIGPSVPYFEIYIHSLQGNGTHFYQIGFVFKGKAQMEKDLFCGFRTRKRTTEECKIVKDYGFSIFRENYYLKGAYLKEVEDNSKMTHLPNWPCEPFGAGDTVGCGYHWPNKQWFFTKNGKFITKYKWEPPAHRVQSALKAAFLAVFEHKRCIQEVKIGTNFGAESIFKYQLTEGDAEK